MSNKSSKTAALKKRFENLSNEYGWSAIEWSSYFAKPETIVPEGCEDIKALVRTDENKENVTKSNIVTSSKQSPSTTTSKPNSTSSSSSKSSPSSENLEKKFENLAIKSDSNKNQKLVPKPAAPTVISLSDSEEDDEKTEEYDEEIEHSDHSHKDDDSLDEEENIFYSDDDSTDDDDDDDEDYEDKPRRKRSSNSSSTSSSSSSSRKKKQHTKHQVISSDSEEEKEDRGNSDKLKKRSTSTAVSSSIPELSKKEFEKKRDALFKHYYDEFNKTVFNNKLFKSSEVELEWNKKLRSTAGYAKLKERRKTGANGEKYVESRSYSILLNPKVIDSVDRLRKTLAHEMCHAAAFYLEGNYKPAHGAVFYKYAGFVQKVYPEIQVTTCHSYDIDYKFIYNCKKCNRSIKRHSKIASTTKCKCGASGEDNFTRVQKDGTQVQTKMNKYNIWVQQNHERIKQKHPNLSGQELFKVMSEEYRKSNTVTP